MATRKIKRYAGGGGLYGIPEQTEQEASNERSLDADLQRREMLDRAYAEGAQDDGPGRSSYATTPSPAREEPTYSSRGEAFKAARANGDKTFMYNGKSYTTEMAGETKKSAPAVNSTYRNEGESVKPTGTSSNEGRNAPKPLKQVTQSELAESYLKKRGAELEAARSAKKEVSALAKRNPSPPSKPVMSDRVNPRDVNSRMSNAFTSGKSYAKGGMVSSASKRGDGIAQRGKTRGKVC